MDEMEQRVRDRLATLMAERDKFIENANAQIAAINAVIGELKALLGENVDQVEESNHNEQAHEKVAVKE